MGMGRIKTTRIMSDTKKLYKLYGDKFATEFNQNKIVLGEHAVLQSKKIRNVMAGYMTRLKRKEK